MAFLSSLAERNISYFTIPVALFTSLSPRIISGFSSPGKDYFDPTNPRTYSARLAKSGLDEEVIARNLRAESAVANGFEGLPLFAAAVVAGNSAGLGVKTLNALSISYIVSRVLYNWVYVFFGSTPNRAAIRTPIWFVGIGAAFTLFIKAGLAKR